MKHEDLARRNASIAAWLSHLPRKMLAIHGHDHLPIFVLHELCHEGCFDLVKAAYLVDNPDFDCVQGVAGVAREHAMNACDIWGNCDQFVERVAQSPFNHSVRNVAMRSARRGSMTDETLAKKVCAQLGMRCDGYCSWTMKHANHGLLVFEQAQTGHPLEHEHILNGASLLSFCPIV